MGGIIEGVAFMPPDRRIAQRELAGKNVQFLDTKENEKIAMMHFPAPAHSANASKTHGQVILFCHGNAEDLGTSHSAYAAMAAMLGVDIFAFDPPGYGLSRGNDEKPGEQAYIRAADTVCAHLMFKLGIARDRILIMGRSLGSGVATDLASRHRGHAGLILCAPLKSCANVAGKTAGVLLYLNDIFTNIRKIGDVRDFPVLILHGDRDEVVPYSHGVALYEEVKPKNRHSYFVTLSGAGHNDIEQVRSREFFGAIRDFIAETPQRRAELKADVNAALAARLEAAAPSSSSISCRD